MRSLSLIACCGLVLILACGGDSSESNGEIDSQADVQALFEAVVPDLVDAFTELANQQSLAASMFPSSNDKGGGSTSSVPCPRGGTLEVDTGTGHAMLVNCRAGGLTLSASLALFVVPTGPSSYQASFNGPLMVTGSFNGTVDVVQASVEWTVPATESNTLWSATALVAGQTFTVSGGGTGIPPMLECEAFDPPGGPNTGQPGTACDEDLDCESNSCRGPELDSQFGCTCRDLAGEDCTPVRVVPGTVEFGGACDDQEDCQDGLPCIDCVCIGA